MREKSNRIGKLLADRNKTDDEVFEEIFLASLGRYPRPEEIAVFKDHMKSTSNRTNAFTDVTWALINTREFILNH
jgi:hypothetical protein